MFASRPVLDMSGNRMLLYLVKFGFQIHEFRIWTGLAHLSGMKCILTHVINISQVYT